MLRTDTGVSSRGGFSGIYVVFAECLQPACVALAFQVRLQKLSITSALNRGNDNLGGTKRNKWVVAINSEIHWTELSAGLNVSYIRG